MIDDDGADKPLDPALERVRRKMIRLLAVSIAVLLVGLIAVLSAVVYRSSGGRSADRPASAGGSAMGLADGTDAPISIQAGARVTETDIDANHALLRVMLADGAEELLLVDLSTGAVVSRYPIRVEAPAAPTAP